MPHDPFYWSKPWRALRAAILHARPICEVPGCGLPARHVDHRISRAKGGAPLDAANTAAYCQGHHSSKTAQVDGGFGHRSTAARLTTKGCDANGLPLDPRHGWRS